MREAETKSDKPQQGLVCQRCGCGHLPVIYTRKRPGGRIMRRRECRHCGARMTTWEHTE